MVKHVLLMGFGAIGRQLVATMAPERVAGVVRFDAGVRDVASHQQRGTHHVDLIQTGSPAWYDAVRHADLVVECAGVAAAKQYGPEVIEAGKPLVLTSVGALADAPVRNALLTGAPSRERKLYVTHGAIGGFDVLGSVAAAGGISTVSIRTSKLAAALVQPWMDEEEAARLRALQPDDPALTVFTGGPTAAIEKFPGNVNVAVALAWATRGYVLNANGATESELMADSLERVQVELVADPRAQESSHEITVAGSAGQFDFRFESTPSPENPKTSGLTALSVAHTLRTALEDL